MKSWPAVLGWSRDYGRMSSSSSSGLYIFRPAAISPLNTVRNELKVEREDELPQHQTQWSSHLRRMVLSVPQAHAQNKWQSPAGGPLNYSAFNIDLHDRAVDRRQEQSVFTIFTSRIRSLLWHRGGPRLVTATCFATGLPIPLCTYQCTVPIPARCARRWVVREVEGNGQQFFSWADFLF